MANKYYDDVFNQIEVFHDSNKCHANSMMVSSQKFIYTCI